MREQVLAAVRTAPSTTDLREFALPTIRDDGALLKVEVAGICGTDVKMYAKPVIEQPVIMPSRERRHDRRGGTAVRRAPGPRRRRPCLRRARAGFMSTVLIQGPGQQGLSQVVACKKLTEKAITIKSARGHSFRSVELAIAQLASKRFPLERLTTHTFGLSDVHSAIKAVGGEGGNGVIHVSLLPWQE